MIGDRTTSSSGPANTDAICMLGDHAYDCLERIGKGSFGEVFRGRHLESDQTVAIKVIDLEQAEDEIEDIQQEISVMAQCDSPHVTRYYGSHVVGTKLYLIMEYCSGGELFDHIVRSFMVRFSSGPA